MAKAVKLADIAERVGVSTVTVSKALSGQKGVSEEVREKIRSIAEELGYQQPSAARKSQNQKSYNIGILISERFLDKYESFYWQMYQAVATRATAKGCLPCWKSLDRWRKRAAECRSWYRNARWMALSLSVR